jgi:Vitamin B6 photo-protection and homoeostasis
LKVNPSSQLKPQYLHTTGIGVGDSHASPTAALLLTVLQESMGRIATILFAHRLGTSLEPECKMYRLAADIFNDAAMLLDCLSPALPKASRVALLSLSSVLRSLCGVAAGSSKASLSAHFATQGNLGELNAVIPSFPTLRYKLTFPQKDSSQETIISLMGMLAGSLVVSYISSKWATWTAMIFLLAIHLGTNYLAVRAVCMQTLNRQRANLVFSSLLKQLANDKMTDRGTNGLLRLAYPTPEEVRLQERVFERDGVLRWNGEVLGYCKLGVDLRSILNCFGTPDRKTGSQSGSQMLQFSELLRVFKGCGYIVWYDEPRKTFLVVLEEVASPVTLLKAWMFALYFAKFGTIKEGGSLIEALEDTRSYISQIEEDLIRKVGQTWDLEVSAMETQSGTRIRMTNQQPL